MVNKNRDRRLKEAHARQQERRELKEILLHNGREPCGERPPVPKELQPQICAHTRSSLSRQLR